MKRILSAFIIAGAVFMCDASESKSTMRKIETPSKKRKIENTEDTKYICTIGLEGEGSFTEVYKDKKECKKYCKGGATVCQKTAKKTPVDLEDVD